MLDTMDPYDAGSSDLKQEIEVLQEIYINELQVDRDSRGHVHSVSLQLHPATGDQLDKKWVCLTLVLNPSPQYPDEVPQIWIKNPRGLSEEYVISLQDSLHKLAEEKRGECMLFELIELAKDTLTQGNLPHGECVICKEGFSEKKQFTKTECYHYFHCHCLLRYIKYSEQEIEEEYEAAVRISPHVKVEKKKVVCPVCREPLTYDLSQLEKHQEKDDLDSFSVVISPQVRQIQQQMAALFKKQQSKGGIIDLQAEKDKYLVPSSLSARVITNGSAAFVENCSEEASERRKDLGKQGCNVLPHKDAGRDYVAKVSGTVADMRQNEDAFTDESLQKLACETTSRTVHDSQSGAKSSHSNDQANKFKSRTTHRAKNHDTDRFRNSSRNHTKGNSERHNFSELKTAHRAHHVTSGQGERRKSDHRIGDSQHCGVLDGVSRMQNSDVQANCTQHRDPNENCHLMSEKTNSYYDDQKTQRSCNGKKYSKSFIDAEDEVIERNEFITDVAVSSRKEPTLDSEEKYDTKVSHPRGNQARGRRWYARPKKRYTSCKIREQGDCYKTKDKPATALCVERDASEEKTNYSKTMGCSGSADVAQSKLSLRSIPASSDSYEYTNNSESRGGQRSGGKFGGSQMPNCTPDGNGNMDGARGQRNYSRRKEMSSGFRSDSKQHSTVYRANTTTANSQEKLDSASNWHTRNKAFHQPRYKSSGSHYNYHDVYGNNEEKPNSQTEVAKDRTVKSKHAAS